MKKARIAKAPLKQFLKDSDVMLQIKTVKKFPKLILNEYPFDLQLLNLSRLYRRSRQSFLAIGGRYSPKVCSTMRSLSTQNLFENNIDYTPSFSELMWFKDYHPVLPDPVAELQALKGFSDISMYHEQNHRIIWQLLPPAPMEQHDLRRYLNFAESLVVTLDLALGDEVGHELSLVLERLCLLYRPGEKNNPYKKSKKNYHNYLLAIFCATYYALERVVSGDILKAVNYIFPDQREMNKRAVQRSLELSEQFTEVTNPQWQQLYWQSAAAQLQKIHKHTVRDTLYLPEDPLDLHEEFFYVRQVFDYYGI